MKTLQGRLSNLLKKIGDKWLGEPKILGNYDILIIRKRYVIGINEISNHQRLYLWYGNAKYTPPLDIYFDFDDNAWFQKISVQKFYAIINITHHQETKFSASFSDIMGTLGGQRYLNKQFEVIDDMQIWLLNTIEQSLHHFSTNQ